MFILLFLALHPPFSSSFLFLSICFYTAAMPHLSLSFFFLCPILLSFLQLFTPRQSLHLVRRDHPSIIPSAPSSSSQTNISGRVLVMMDVVEEIVARSLHPSQNTQTCSVLVALWLFSGLPWRHCHHGNFVREPFSSEQ